VPLIAGDEVAGRYRVVGPLGSGGMASVLLVDDLPARKRRVLKELRLDAPDLLAAFRNEFALLASLTHPCLTRVHDFGSAWVRGQLVHFYTADQVEGTTLRESARARAEVPLAALLDAVEGLGALHALDLCHGDVTPENVLVRPDGSGVLIDLGCARAFGPVGGLISGTPEFMAPELRAGESVDARSDLFSVGRTLERAYGLARQSPPAEVSRWISKLTAPRAKDRPASVEALLQGFGRTPGHGFGALRRAPRLLGREAQIEQFSSWLADLSAGTARPRVLALRGPPGAGTSRLLRELVSRAELELVVLRTNADESGGVSWLLSAATGSTEQLSGVRGALAARALLARRTAPCLLAVEDADRLDASEAELLRAFARLLTPSSTTGLLVSGVDPLAGIAAEPLEVGALDRASVKRWVRGALSETALAELLESTAGLPGEIEVELARRARPGAPNTGEAVSELERLVASAKGEQLDRLGLLAAKGGALTPSLFGASVEEFADLEPFVRRERARLRLRSRQDLPRLLRALPAAVLRAQHARAAEVLLADDGIDRSRGVREAEIVAHLLHAGEHERARATLARVEPVWREAPRPFVRQLGESAGLALDAETACTIAEIALLAAEAETARSFAARALSTRPAAALADRARLLGAEALLRLGKPQQAERALTRWLTTAEGEQRAAALERVARARSQRGDHAGAERAAREGLLLSPGPPVTRALNEALAVAASYLGRTAEAEALFERILSEAGEAAPARDRVRLLGAQAIAAFRSGRAAAAAKLHRRGLELAEQHGLDDLVGVCSLNLGTALQQAGDLGGALSSYERGLAVALALGRESSELVLRYDLATLHAEIGDLVRARAELDALGERAEALRLLQLAPAVSMLRAELELLCADFPAARRELESAERAFGERKLERELVEVELLRAELELAEGDTSSALQRALGLATRAEGLAAEDLALRAELGAARAEAAVDGGNARARLERALLRARRSGQDLLEAKISTELCRVLLALGEPEASAQAERARRLWDRLAANLDQAERATFWQDARRDVLERLTARQPPALPGAETAVLRRLLSLARRVNSSLSIERVLDYAVDAAVELSGAERGFILLVEGGSAPRVAAARAGSEPALLPSGGIVERVIESQEAVLTTDALADARFSGQGSVHAMRLKSVLSVPISTPERALGAVYVDSRIQRSRFSEAERDVLVALADQIAVALANARLHADLEQRSRELEQQKRLVERLSLAKDRELSALREEVRAQARTLELRYDYSQIVGRGPAMRAVLEQLDRVMDTGVNVLLLGESGTGKELAARAIHVNGPRSAGAFVGVNCAAMPETLLESELFGHVRGAFTGADRDRKGLLLEADGGTLFLDELGEMPLTTQAKLLRVLQEREVRPLGAARTQPFDVRLVCATQRDLAAEVAAGRFREDLYYRVAVVVVRLPPLRERLEDLPELVRSLVQRIARTAGRKAPEIGRDVLRALAQHAFPGNVRELENVLTRAVVMSPGERIEARSLELNARAPRPRKGGTRQEYEKDERERILEALRETRWNVSVVSRRLGIPRNTLYRKLERYGLQRAELDSAR
jgi:serine/threonine-protein kinase PknK